MSLRGPPNALRRASYNNNNSKINDVLGFMKTSSLGILDASVNSTVSNSMYEQDLFQFAASGDLDGVQTVLARGISINAKDEWGRNALMYAAGEGQVPIGEFLISKGIDLNARNMFEETAFNIAIVTGNIEFSNMLKEHGEFGDANNPESRKDSICEEFNLSDLGIGSSVESLFTLTHEPQKYDEKVKMGHNLTVEVLEGAHLFGLLSPNSQSDLAHVRITVGNEQFNTENVKLREGTFVDVVEWSELFSCKIDPKTQPSIKVVLCDQDEFALGEFTVGFGWYGQANHGIIEWFDLRIPTNSTIKRTGFINKSPISLLEGSSSLSNSKEKNDLPVLQNSKSEAAKKKKEKEEEGGEEEGTRTPPPVIKPRLRLQIILQETEQNATENKQIKNPETAHEMLTVLSTYQTLHVDPVARDVSQTVVSCFTALLDQNILLVNIEQNVERFLKQTQHNVATDLLRDAFLNFQFSERSKDNIIKQVLDLAVPSKNNLSKTIQSFTTSVLSSWQLDPTNINEFVTKVFSRKYEEGVLVSLGLTGAGKYFLPIWPKVVIAVVITTYVILTDTYKRFVDEYFSSKKRTVTKLLNPDYAGRFARSVFDALVKHKLGRVSRPTSENFLRYLLEFDRDEVKASSNTTKRSKLSQRFLQEWTKSVRPFSREKYITTRNFLLANVSTLSLQAQEILNTNLKPPRLVDSASRKNSIESEDMSLPQTPPYSPTSSMLGTAIVQQQRNLTSLSRALKKTENHNGSSGSFGMGIGGTAHRPLLPSASNRALLVSNLNEGPADISKIIPGLFFVDNNVRNAISLHNFFYKSPHVRVIKNLLSEITDDKYDCMIVPANPWCAETVSPDDVETSPLHQLKKICGQDVMTNLLHKIRNDYFGELPVGTSVLLEVPPDVHTVRYIVYTAVGPQSAPFSLMWSAFLAISGHNRKIASSNKKNRRSPIRTAVVLSSGLYSKDASREHTSKQIYLAHEQWEQSISAGKTVITDPDQVQKGRLRIDEEPLEKMMRQRQHFEAMLKEGFIESRKFVDDIGIDMLLDCLVDLQQDQPEDSKGKKKPTKVSSSLGGSLKEGSSPTSKFKESIGSSTGSLASRPPTAKLNKDFFKDLRRGHGEKFELQKAAAAALIHYTFPIEKVTGTRKKLEQLSVLDAIIEFAASGKISSYSPIDRSEIEFTEKDEIAQGVSGKVYKGTYKGQPVAVKHCSPHFIYHDDVDVFREISVLCLLRHKNILSCFGAAHVGTDSFMVSEFIDGPTLHQWVRQQPARMDIVAGLTVCVQIARALVYIHNLHILHCDLKSKNILVQQTQHSEDILAKIIDFGSSRTLNYEPELRIPVGTPHWMAPEVTQKKGYTPKSDIFSLGMVYCEIITRREPFETNAQQKFKPQDVSPMIESGKRPSISKEEAQWCPPLVKLLEKAWQHKPEKRPSAQDIVQALSEIAEGFHFTFKP